MSRNLKTLTLHIRTERTESGKGSRIDRSMSLRSRGRPTHQKGLVWGTAGAVLEAI